MIELRTGVPGSGKTLSAVEALAKMVARWESHPDEARPVFVHGVKDLAIPHAPVPTKTVQANKAGAALEVPDWDAMPDGSFVLIDEAQGFFPPRSSASTAPDHVAWLNTHRHRGFDITVITQHPKLIDGAVRALVGKHLHYRRLFGGARAVCYEWDACSDSLAGLANAVKSYYAYPKKAFQFYKSAEIHTKQRFRVPLWFALPVVSIVIGAIAVPRAYSTISDGIAGKGLASAAAPKAGSAASAPAALAAASGATAAPGSTSAPGPAGRAAALPAAPTVAGCMAMRSRCICVDSAGTVAPVSEAQCREAAVALGGLVPYDVGMKKAAEVRVQAGSDVPAAVPVHAQAGQLHGFNAGDYRARSPRTPVASY